MVSLSEICQPEQGVDRVVSSCGAKDFGPFRIPFHYTVSLGRRDELPDMTLIAVVWSPEGFAIAADGLQMWTKPPRRNEHAQKIFSTPFENGTGFAFAWSGTVALHFTLSGHFDFTDLTHRTLSELPTCPPDNPESYFQRIARNIFMELPSHVELQGVYEARVIFVGYFNGMPLWVEIRFPHSPHGFLPPVVNEPKQSPRYFNVFAGSETVLKQMQESNVLSQPLSLSEAANLVHLYAETCVASNRTIPDCANLGGKVHVATVTTEGFSWAIPPIDEPL